MWRHRCGGWAIDLCEGWAKGVGDRCGGWAKGVGDRCGRWGLGVGG